MAKKSKKTTAKKSKKTTAEKPKKLDKKKPPKLSAHVVAKKLQATIVEATTALEKAGVIKERCEKALGSLYAGPAQLEHARALVKDLESEK